MDFIYPITTLSFAYPYVLLAPFLYSFFMLFQKSRSLAVYHFSISDLKSIGIGPRVFFRRLCIGTLAPLFVIALTIAAARPQRISVLAQDYKSRNLMLAIDVSPSMSANDFASGSRLVSRIRGVKTVVSDFINARQNDRIGLVIFGGRSFLQAPLTRDHDLLLELLGKLEVGMAGDGTAIGDGLGLSLKRIQKLMESLKQSSAEAPAAVILVTDGVSNAGQVNPLKAARVAKDLGIKVHTIGIGSHKPVTMTLPGGIITQQFQSRVEFDEKTLQEIATITGGVYFNASSVEGLSSVYHEIDKLEATSAQDDKILLADELYPIFLKVALCAFLALLFLGQGPFMKLP